MLTEAEAKARLAFTLASTSEPTLSDADLVELLAESKLFEFWEASTAYVVGDVVQPTTPNGHRYLCVYEGTTGASEPTWPEYREGQVSDGTAIFQELGPANLQQWDLRRAAHLGWLHKAAKVAADYTFSVDGQSFSRSHQYDHCLEMARRFQPVTVA